MRYSSCLASHLMNNCLLLVPVFPGNDGVLIPGNPGMRRTGRPGNGSPGMKTLVAWSTIQVADEKFWYMELILFAHFQNNSLAVNGTDTASDALVPGAMSAADSTVCQTGTDSHRQSASQVQQTVRHFTCALSLVLLSCFGCVPPLKS